MDVTTDYLPGNDPSAPQVVLSTNDDLKLGVKLVIDNSVEKVGASSFSSCQSLKEVIILNDTVIFLGMLHLIIVII